MGKILFGAIVGGMLAWGYFSPTAAEDLQAVQNEYCQMVEEGTWPDYKGVFDESCK